MRRRTQPPFSKMHINSFHEREHLSPPSCLHLHWRPVLNLLRLATPHLPRSHSSGGGSGQRVDSGRQCRKFRQMCQISFFSSLVLVSSLCHPTATVIVAHPSCGHVQRVSTSEESRRVKAQWSRNTFGNQHSHIDLN